MSEQNKGVWGLVKDLSKDLLTSKKFMAFASGVVVNIAVLGASKFGIPEEQAQAAALKITGLVGAYIIGQGAADMNKEAKKLELKAKE